MSLPAAGWGDSLLPAPCAPSACSDPAGTKGSPQCWPAWRNGWKVKKKHALTNLINLPYWASLGNTLREGPLSKECQHNLGTFTCVMQVSVPRVEQKLHTRLRRHHVCDWLRAMDSRLLVAHDVVTHHLRPAQQGSMNQDALRKLHQA